MSKEIPEESWEDRRDRVEEERASKEYAESQVRERLEALKAGAPKEAPVKEQDPLAPENLERSFSKAVDAVLTAMIKNLSVEQLPLYESTKTLLEENKPAILEMATAKFGHEKKTMDQAMGEAVTALIKSEQAKEQTRA
jgi:hypothetical protein